MSKHWNHYSLLIVCVVLALTTTACFRDSAEGVGSQPVSQLLESATPIPQEPTAVLEVEETEEVVLEVEETEEVVLEVPTSTATDEPVLVLPSETPTATQDGTATQIAMLNAPTSTLTVDPLFLRLTASATPTGGIVNVGNTVPGGTAIAQNFTEEPPDNFSLTATALIGQLTQDAAAVATTQAFNAGIGTTPSPFPTSTTDPFSVSPTPLQSQSQNLIPGADCIHQIRVGETLFKLSLAYGVSVQEMATASGITNPSLILVGQRVTIPSCGTTGFTPPPTSVPVPTAVVAASDTTTNQAQVAVPGAGNSTATTNTLAQAAQQEILTNAQADVQANAVAQGAAPATGTRQYTVQQYDTLFQIAQQFGTSVDAIAVLNGITNINQITMNDVLQIP